MSQQLYIAFFLPQSVYFAAHNFSVSLHKKNKEKKYDI